MTRGLPDWQPFVLDSEDPSPLELSGMRGSALVILAAPRVDESGWAVRAAARIAAQRVGRNGRLLLADLDLRHPRLHMELGADNGEGISDTFLFGASLQRVARPVDAGFLFVPAGTAVADPEPVLSSDRWTLVFDGFQRAGAELFLFVPWDTPGRDAILARARNLVLLAERSEAEAVEIPDLGGLRLGAILGPPMESDADPASPATVPEAEVTETEPPVTETEPSVTETEPPVKKTEPPVGETEPPIRETEPPVGDAEPPVGDTEPVGSTAAPEAPVPSDEPMAADPAEVEPDETLPAAVPAPTLEEEERPPAAPSPRPALARDRAPEEFDRLFKGEERGDQAERNRVTDRTESERTGDGTVHVRVEDVNRRSRRVLVLLGVLVLLLLALAAAALVGLVEIPGIPVLAAFEGSAAPGAVGAAAPPARAVRDDAPPAGTVSAPAAGGVDAEPLPPFSLAVGSYQELEPAQERAAALRAATDDLLVIVAPVEVDARRWHRVLVGPLEDTASAEALKEALAGEGGESGSSGWFVRSTPLALDVGTVDSREEARRIADELSASGLPSYVLEVPAGPPPAAPRFRVYVGAYADEAEAAAARLLLREHGFDRAELVPRVGRIPSISSPPAE